MTLHAHRQSRRGFALVVMMMLLTVATLASLVSLRAANTALNLATNRAAELHAERALDDALARGVSDRVSARCDLWPLDEAQPSRLAVTTWIWSPNDADARQRQVFTPLPAAQSCPAARQNS